jgi:hypothetical protein
MACCACVRACGIRTLTLGTRCSLNKTLFVRDPLVPDPPISVQSDPPLHCFFFAAEAPVRAGTVLMISGLPLLLTYICLCLPGGVQAGLKTHGDPLWAAARP